MAMTAPVKAELANTQITKTCCRKAEVASMLRFAGGLHIVSGRIVVEAELDTGAAARRLRKDISEVYGHQSDVVMVQGNGIRKGSRYIVRVVKDGEALARQTGLLDQRGRPVRGLPPAVVSGGGCDAVAAWRGAFLAHGSLTEPGRSSALEVTCPGPEAALALVGVARRLGIQAKAREVRGVDRVVIRDGDAIGALLTRLGAHESLMAWEERRMRREVRATANRLANFDDANLRRSARAAVAAGARVERALEILAEEVPDHLKLAGHLRLEHKQASLEELGQLHDPVLTKDAIAGRIRRLLAMADKRAEELGIPDTEASLTPEMLAEITEASGERAVRVRRVGSACSSIDAARRLRGRASASKSLGSDARVSMRRVGSGRLSKRHGRACEVVRARRNPWGATHELSLRGGETTTALAAEAGDLVGRLTGRG